VLTHIDIATHTCDSGSSRRRKAKRKQSHRRSYLGAVLALCGTLGLAVAEAVMK